MNNFIENSSLEKIEKKTESITLTSGNSVEVEQNSPGTFKVIDFSMAESDLDDPLATSRGFISWDNEITNLEEESDTYQVLGVSEHLKWNDVELTPDEIKAPTLERLK